MTSWRELVPCLVSTVIESYFVDDTEFAVAVVTVVESIMDTGDIHQWAELKRFDAHASKHGRISPDHLLNLVFTLINRVCNMNAKFFCPLYREILYDRMEGFHNQCRDDHVPQTIVAHKPKHLFLHMYNAKSYGSILQLVATYLLKSDDAVSLGKRIASNHNHWFNFGHLIDFTKSLVDATSETCHELWSHLGVAIFALVSGMCGTRLGNADVIMDATGVTLQGGWIGALAVDVNARVKHTPTVVSALNCLSSLRYRDIGHGRSVLNVLIASHSDDQAIACEWLNALTCILQTLDVKEWSDIHLEQAHRHVLNLAVVPNASPRFAALLLVWFRIACYTSPIDSAALVVWNALLALDSPVMDFVLDSLSHADSYVVLCATELLRVMLQRDLQLGGRVAATLVARTLRRPVAPLTTLITTSWSVRRAWKACGYILHQCILRESKAVSQVVDKGPISVSLSRMLLDPDWDDEEIGGNEECGLGNFSNVTLVSLRNELWTAWLTKLEFMSEACDAPCRINTRLEYWLVHDNVECINSLSGVYAETSARLMALFNLYESGGQLKTILLGLTETATGIVTDDTVAEILAIDALLLLLNSPPDSDKIGRAQTEYLFALKVVGDTLDEDVSNRVAVLKNVQHHWPNRFAILAAFLEENGGIDLVGVDQVTEMLRLAAVEFVVAGQLVEAQHVANMRAAGAALIAADVSRGHLRIVDFMEQAFAAIGTFTVPYDDRFVLAELTTTAPTLPILAFSTLTRLVDNITATLLEYGALVSERERSEIFAFLVESLAPQGSPEYQYCMYARMLPKLLLGIVASAEMLPFYLRMVKRLCLEAERQTSARSILTQAGIVESIALCLLPFAGSEEIWMIEKDHTLSRSAITYMFDSVVSEKQQSLVPLSVLLSLVASKSFPTVSIVRDLIQTKYKSKVELLLTDQKSGPLMKELCDCLDAEVLLHEIGI